MVGDMRNKWFPYVKVAGLKCLFVYLKVRIFKFSYRSFHFSIFSFVFLVLKNFFCILLFFQSHFFLSHPLWRLGVVPPLSFPLVFPPVGHCSPVVSSALCVPCYVSSLLRLAFPAPSDSRRLGPKLAHPPPN
jgi:hypothetical protein